MVEKFDRNDRRILKFPAINPCEDISPVTLLESLIKISQTISNSQTKFFPTQRKKSRELNRQILILSMFFDEIRANFYSNISYSIILCLSELHLTFQKVQFLLEDCTREGARTWILMKSHVVATQFRGLVRTLSTALDVLPLNSMDISLEIKELVEMLADQLRKAKMEVESLDEIALKRVILVLNQLENKLEPDPFMIRKILAHLHINSWGDCHKEIKFLEDEIGMAYSDGDEREVPLLSGLLGFLSYCRGILFEDCDFVSLEQSNGRNSNFENLSCLNPEDFRCPISLELMTDPVTVSTGQTYDRVSIQKWLKSGNLICPKTGGKLTSTELVPNTSLKKLIQQFCGEYGVSLTKSRKNSRDLSRTILPGSPANAEAIRFLSQFLALRLSYGSGYQQNKAAYEIRILAKSNLYNRSCLIEAGTIPPLMEMVGSSDPGIQENAISALLKLSKQPAGQKDIIQNGGLDLITSVIRNGLKPESKQIAAAIIFYLGSVHEQRKIIGEKNQAIPALLELIRDGTHCGKKNSVVAIFALLLYHRNRQRALEAGAVSILLGLLASSDKAEMKTDALAVLSTLADSFDGSMAILRASALPVILGLLHSMETRAGKEYCVSTLHSLCLNCGSDVVAVLAKDKSLMSTLYSLLTDGTSHAGRKSRSLIKILQKFSETSSSRVIKDVRQERFVDVR